jgi:hypothetical protein
MDELQNQPVPDPNSAQPAKPQDIANQAEALLQQPVQVHAAPTIDLLSPQHPTEPLPATQAEPAAPPVEAMAPISTPAAATDTSGAHTAIIPHHRQLWPVVIVGALVVLASGSSAYMIYRRSSAKQPTAPPVSVPATKPATPDTSQAVAPQPTPPPAADTVTAPAVTPTADKPQTVTVRSQNGLWLRSTPDSSNRNNIISWIPNGAQVLVDQTGEFWWHGTYKGQTGYFASTYTK